MDVLKSWPAAQPGGPGRPFITYYDLASGERTELSGTTTGNWVAKVANLLVDEFDAEPGFRVAVTLPTHWLRPVWCLATWMVGGTVVDAHADLVVCGPDKLADAPSTPHRVASALLPFGMPFPTPPAGFIDLASVLPGQPDTYLGFADAEPTDPAVDIAGCLLTYADLGSADESGDRLLFAAGTLARDVTATLAAARGGGSLVLVSNATNADSDRLAGQEQARIA